MVSGVNALKLEASTDRRSIRNNTLGLGEHKNNKNSFYKAPSSIILKRVNNDEKNPLVKTFVSSNDNKKRNNIPIKNSKLFIGGPSQPEMSSFKSVGADNMVSLFTGDFSYNIPLLDVGGYPVNMFYNSGISMDQEASWVGLGWNINPGTITRNMRGIPDDFDGTEQIVKEQYFKSDKTFGLTAAPSLKFLGLPLKKPEASIGISWNNKLGVSAQAGLSAEASLGEVSTTSKTTGLSLGFSLNAGARAGASFSPTLKITHLQNNSLFGTQSLGVGFSYSSRVGLSSMHLDYNASKPGKFSNGDDYSQDLYSHSGTLSFMYPSVTPSITKPFTSINYSINLSSGSETYGFFKNLKLSGYYSETYIDSIDSKTSHSAYGMLNYEKGKLNPDALLDFNRANDGVYTPNSPTIAMPVYTYDVFSIGGEGTGGSFRAYRGDVGHVTDARVKSKDESASLSVNLGFLKTLHVGADISKVHSPTEVGDWKVNNLAAQAFSFQKSDGLYQAAYFKNPGEKTVPDMNFHASIADEDLVRLKLTNIHSGSPMLVPSLMRFDANKNFLGEKNITASETKKMDRDKRTQSISFLTAEESERIGMNTKLYSYNAEGAFENNVTFGLNCDKYGIDSFYRNHDNKEGYLPSVLGNEDKAFRHKNHISQIDVLGTDGKKYVYGLPVYNKTQQSVTFSINRDQRISDSKAQYDVGDDSEDNNKGRDAFMEKETIPSYTHSFLLTELVSPNYVDITGDGITEDDMGDAVKFNYSKTKDFKWRTPNGLNVGSYSEGLKTDEKDDKANYIYGERESWYLYSVESKNMIARFYVKNDRKDGRAVVDINGQLDANNGLQRLDKICLFSKADVLKLGNTAKPIKTIQFFQSYKLTPNTENNNGECIGKFGSTPGNCNSTANLNRNKGKLTLDSIYISYNGNQAKAKSRYVFYYPETNNPGYSFDQTDRWGTYKPKNDNPGNLTNSDYPYSTQDKVKADANAAAWTMNKILLPSGAVVKIDYESDSYAYVQNKVASNMFKVLGFGNNTTPNLSSPDKVNLYKGSTDNDYVYVQLSDPILATGNAAKVEFAEKYLKDVKQLYLKLSVQMPTGNGLSGIAGYETIPVYADVDQYGLISANVAWIKVKKLSSGSSPMVQSALQFLIQQLPGKAYKGYDLSEQSGLKSIVLALGGILSSVKGMFKGELNLLRSDGKCQKAVLENTFVKLSNPTRNKLGGGLRVKKVVINDNWNKMTRSSASATDGMLNATYGQEYKYETTELINGKLEKISSGVASWEPSIGGDENPHREIMRFLNRNTGGPYDYGAIEMPLGEMFYPSAFVGYRKVEVLSIHRDTVKNLPTRSVSEFYTTKEFPYKSSATSLTGDANVLYQPSPILQLLKIDMMKSVTQSQGFLIETNDMNGKEKSQAVYTANDATNPISLTRNYYNIKAASDQSYSFNHVFPVIANADGRVSNAVIGKDIELMTDFREHDSKTISANVSVNFDGFIAGFFPFAVFNVLRPIYKSGLTYRSASVLKVVSHFGVLDSVVVIDKGSMVSTKNLVYDAETGNPLLTRTQNEHNKPIYNFSYPAHWAYSGMGPAYKNIDAVFSKLNFSHGILLNPPSGIYDVLESGDELYVHANNGFSIPASPPCDDINAPITAWTTLAKTTTNRIWAVNTSKTGEGTNQWVFMDANGHPVNIVAANVRIVRSGKRNMVDQSVGTITSMQDPRVKTTSGGVTYTQLVFNDATNIIQTAVATFKDNWRVDNSFFKILQTVHDTTFAKVKRIDLYANDHVTVTYNRHYRNNGYLYSPNYLFIEKDVSIPLYKHTEYYWKRDNWIEGKKSHNIDNRKNSFLLFSYDGLPVNAQLYKGLLSLNAHSNFSEPNFSPSSNANHPNIHNNIVAQNNPSLLGEVTALNKQWYSTTNTPTNASNWVNNYFNSNSANVSIGKGIIPKPTTPWEDYKDGPLDNRINVTLPLSTISGTILSSQKQLAFKLRNANDEKDPHSGDGHDYRCFWSPTKPLGMKVGGRPTLSYYYFECGDLNDQPFGAFPTDPYVNQLITCITNTITGEFCRSIFLDKKAINPYVQGVLGNWRIDTTYAYYGERKESDANVNVDTRTAGAIKNYSSFWNFASNPVIQNHISRNIASSNVWVWNNAITQYNRKGYEIENTDPLGRFNAGLYGYNQQLPIAVANNARVREIMFDGFEDADYQSTGSCVSCPPRKYINYNTNINTKIDASQKHTGRYSLRVDGSSSVEINAPITAEPSAINHGIKINAQTNNYSITGLGTGGVLGTGLKASFYNHAVVSYSERIALEPAPSLSYPQAALIYTIPATPVGIQGNETTSPAPGVNPVYFSAKWEGKIQAPATGNYSFRTVGDNGFRIKVNGVQLSDNRFWIGNGSPTQTGGGTEANSASIALTAGQVYSIEISYYNQWGSYKLDVQWKTPLTGNAYTAIPLSSLYTPTSTTFRNVITQNLICNRLDSVQVTGQALTDTFSLIQNKKMILSAWVKVGTSNCCFPETYSDNGNSQTRTNSITIKYNSGATDKIFQPVGNIIEGWQRYESEFTIPSNANSITVSLNNTTASTPVYFDDIRILPFNANMKSFAYHSSNLRLMAELDENNYASFYEYDDDGTLTRVKKETQRGIKTITETRSATQKRMINED